MNKKRGLGRGLDALIGAGAAQKASEGRVVMPGIGSPTDGEMRDLPVDIIQRGKYQPRIDMHAEALEELAASIKAQGVVQPIVVRPIGEGRYEIIAGERRWRATQIAGLHQIPAIIRDVPDEAAIAMALIENIQREDLNPMEEAVALQRLIDEFAMTHQQAAEAVGRSRVAVSNLLRLIALQDDVKRLLTNGDLEMGHARALLALMDQDQVRAARVVVAKNMTVRDTERFVRRLVDTRDNPKAETIQEDPDVQKLESELADKLGAKIKVQHNAKGKGRLEIHFNTLDELDGILAHIK